MKVLLDEMLPAGLAELLPGLEVTTVKRAGFTGLDNGALIRRAVAAGFDFTRVMRPVGFRISETAR